MYHYHTTEGMKIRRFYLIAFFATIVGVFTPGGGHAQGISTLKLGTNLNEVNDYSPQLPFTDIFLFSRSWLTQCSVGIDPGCTSGNAFDTGESASLDVDGNGWVRTLPGRSAASVYTSVATFWDLPAQFPSKRYIVLYDGKGSIEYGIGAEKETSLSRSGRDVISVDISRGGILLKISSTDPDGTGNYIRNIRVVAEEDEATMSSNRFSADFLRRLTPYSALRFMDWMRTNNSVVTSWSGRAKVTDARFSTEQGVPIEIMVELSNKTNKAPWFTIPHQVNDTFVRNFATLVKDSLEHDLPVIVEYSNETWNGGFSQGAWIESEGEREWPGGSETGFTKRMNWHGKRSAEICDIWRDVFGAQSSRVVCVIATQAANSWTASEALSCPLWTQAPCAGHGIKALAIAPYMGDYLGQEDSYVETAGWASDGDGGFSRLFEELAQGGVLSSGPGGGALAQSLGWVDDNLTVANNFNVSLVAYEGGQHLVGVGNGANNDTLTGLFTAANRDTRMKTLYQSYLNGWAARGGGLFMHFTDIGAYSRYGSWGALEEIGQTTSPKYEALYEYGTGSAPPGIKTLRVRKAGRGTVLSQPSGIQCGSNCLASFSAVKVITLIAKPERGFRLVRWSGACTHSRSRCNIPLSKVRSAAAIFQRVPR